MITTINTDQRHLIDFNSDEALHKEQSDPKISNLLTHKSFLRGFAKC